MNQINSEVKVVGTIDLEIQYADGTKELKHYKNAVLQKGREALAASIANQYGDTYEYYITHMLFGNGGTEGGVPKYVSIARNGLFGITLLSKPVMCVIDPNFPSQVVFNSVVTFDEAIGETINELALQMHNGDIYSMSTMGDISKSGAMQLSWAWRVSFI